MTTRVVHRSRRHDVYIGRPSKWGNPFYVTKTTRVDAVRRFRNWVITQPQLLAALHELRGQRLGCFCSPRLCHGDVLALLADGVPPHSIDIWI